MLRMVKLTTSLPGVIILNILAVYLACSMPNTDSILMTIFIKYNFISEVSLSVSKLSENEMLSSFKPNNKAFFSENIIRLI